MSKKKNDGFSMFKCPECGSMKSAVIDSRPSRGRTRRRRECDKGHRITTYESVDREEMVAVLADIISRKDGIIQEQDRIIGQLTRERDEARQTIDIDRRAAEMSAAIATSRVFK